MAFGRNLVSSNFRVFQQNSWLADSPVNIDSRWIGRSNDRQLAPRSGRSHFSKYSDV